MTLRRTRAAQHGWNGAQQPAAASDAPIVLHLENGVARSRYHRDSTADRPCWASVPPESVGVRRDGKGGWRRARRGVEERRLEEEIARLDAGGSSLEGSAPIPPEEQHGCKQPLDKVLLAPLADEHGKLLDDETRRARYAGSSDWGSSSSSDEAAAIRSANSPNRT